MPEGLEGEDEWSRPLRVFENVSSFRVIGNAHVRPEMICIFVVFKWSLLCWTIAKEKPADLCWCAAPWCHFLCLWGKRGGSGPGGRLLRTVCFPWQLEDIQLLRILLLNAIQIFGIQVHFFLSRLSLIPFSWNCCHVPFHWIQRRESHAASLILVTLKVKQLFSWGLSFFSPHLSKKELFIIIQIYYIENEYS